MTPDASYVGLVAKFELIMVSDGVPPKERTLQGTTEESVFDPDLRVSVDRNLYQDRGIYRSVVKLQMCYEQDKSGTHCQWYMGTGWLIKPDIIVTAAHNVCKWAKKKQIRKATEIKCHIGYHGKKFIGEEGVQSRHAKRWVIPAEWLASKKNHHRDFALIQVDEPFTGELRVFSYKETPSSGSEQLVVIGYPGDRSIEDSSGRKDWGAEMHMQSSKIEYNRVENTLRMLTYKISTFSGQSGSPVVRDGTHEVIATHVRGPDDGNQASPIRITDYDNLLRVITQECPKVNEIEGVVLHDPTGGHQSIGQSSENHRERRADRQENQRLAEYLG